MGNNERDAENILQCIRIDSGLFVQHSIDTEEYGFWHRTFQNYFAARYLLMEITKDKKKAIDELIRKFSLKEQDWRESFKMALAYQILENRKQGTTISHDILTDLFNIASNHNLEDKSDTVTPIIEALLEIDPVSMSEALKKRITAYLFELKKEVSQNEKYELYMQMKRLETYWSKCVVVK